MSSMVAFSPLRANKNAPDARLRELGYGFEEFGGCVDVERPDVANSSSCVDNWFNPQPKHLQHDHASVTIASMVAGWRTLGDNIIETESFQIIFQGLFSEINLGSDKLGKR